MPSFSQHSKDQLATCHPDIQLVMGEVIRGYDIRVIEGLRSLERQQALYAQGRTTPGKIVTHADGVRVRSRHQAQPGESFSRAVDIAPWVDGGIPWSDIPRFHHLAGWVERVAGEMGIPLTWGGHWKMKDYPHWQLPEGDRR